MLNAVKGVYDNGRIILLEEPPVNVKTNVIVTFLPEENNNELKEKQKIKLGRR